MKVIIILRLNTQNMSFLVYKLYKRALYIYKKSEMYCILDVVIENEINY